MDIGGNQNMVFSSTVFLFLFLPAVLLAYFIGRSRTWRNAILLLASLGFYAWGEPQFVWVMLFAIALNWYIVRVMERAEGKKRKYICTLVICGDVLLLFIYKYLTFVLENMRLLIGSEEETLSLALPIGISFFTFQMMSYVFDVYYKKCEAQKKFWKTALYVCLFPQLIAGPIVRYETISLELDGRRELPEEFAQGIYRFIYGLGKKVLLANYLGLLADQVFDSTKNVAVATAWLGAVFYTLQIYFDFSGYSDMAIGLGLVFGFHFSENFDFPYVSASVTEFWRRWHISLSSWFRDYVYIPMGGNRVSSCRQAWNLFVVWALTGIWHGANWTFFVWGMYYFLLLIFEKYIAHVFLERHRLVGHIYTILAFVMGWVIFRSADLSGAVRYIGRMFGLCGNPLWDAQGAILLRTGAVFLTAAVLLSMPIVREIMEKLGDKGKRIFVAGTSAGILFLSILSCIKSTYNPFIYFNF
jgi:D-alanyl-lipoteichoic acid acyltransferase DltB (MBOAT superfamily)